MSKKMKLAYMREHTPERPINNSELLQYIKKANIANHNVFVDDKGKEEIEELLELLEEDDILLIRSFTDLADTHTEMIKIVKYLQDKKIRVYAIEEDALSGEKYVTAMRQVQNIINYYTEIKRKAGYQKALEAQRIGRPPLTEQKQKAIKLFLTGKFTTAEIISMCSISESTLRRALKEYKKSLKKKLEETKN